jgi:hypothetical protein
MKESEPSGDKKPNRFEIDNSNYRFKTVKMRNNQTYLCWWFRGLVEGAAKELIKLARAARHISNLYYLEILKDKEVDWDLVKVPDDNFFLKIVQMQLIEEDETMSMAIIHFNQQCGNELIDTTKLAALKQQLGTIS